MTVLIVALVLGLVGAYGVRSYLQGEEPVINEPPTFTVPFANTDLPADRVITRDDLVVLPTSMENLKARGIPTSALVMTSPQDLVGRRLREPHRHGEPFLSTDFYLAGTGPNFAERLKPGFRAVSLKVRDFQTGTVTAGAYVDILFRATPRRGDDKTAAIPEVTVPLLKNIEVLDVADASGAVGGDVVTLAVPSTEVNTLRVVEDRGEFSLALRSPDEIIMLASTEPQRKTLEDVLGIEPTPPPPQPFRTAVYRRGQMQVNSFVSASGGQLVAEAEIGPANKSGCKTCRKKPQDANLIPVPDTGLGDPSPTLAPPRPQSGAVSN